MAYYTDFSKHCLRFYARYPEPEFHSDVDRLNWQAARTTLSGYPQLNAIYSGARRPEDSDFRDMEMAEREVAVIRGLVGDGKA